MLVAGLSLQRNLVMQQAPCHLPAAHTHPCLLCLPPRAPAGMYTAMVALFLPGVVLILGSGFVFGFWRGLLAVWAGGAVGQALAFLLARYLFHGWVETTLKQRWKKWAIIDKAIEHDGWKLVLIMRFSPIIPYNLVGASGWGGWGVGVGGRRGGWPGLACLLPEMSMVRPHSQRSSSPDSFPCTRPPTHPPGAAEHRDGHHQHPLLAVHNRVGGGHHLRVRRLCLLWQVRLRQGKGRARGAAAHQGQAAAAGAWARVAGGVGPVEEGSMGAQGPRVWRGASLPDTSVPPSALPCPALLLSRSMADNIHAIISGEGGPPPVFEWVMLGISLVMCVVGALFVSYSIK